MPRGLSRILNMGEMCLSVMQDEEDADGEKMVSVECEMCPPRRFEHFSV